MPQPIRGPARSRPANLTPIGKFGVGLRQRPDAPWLHMAVAVPYFAPKSRFTPCNALWGSFRPSKPRDITHSGNLCVIKPFPTPFSHFETHPRFCHWGEQITLGAGRTSTFVGALHRNLWPKATGESARTEIRLKTTHFRNRPAGPKLDLHRTGGDHAPFCCSWFVSAFADNSF